MSTTRIVSNTYTFGSETFNIPCSARYGSFSPSPSLLTCSAPDAGRAEPKQNSTVSSEVYIRSDPQNASMVLQYCGVSDMGSMVATVRCSRLCKARKVLRRKESDQGAPVPSDAMVRDRTRGITRFSLRNTVGKVSLSHWSTRYGLEIGYRMGMIPCNDRISSNFPSGNPGPH